MEGAPDDVEQRGVIVSLWVRLKWRALSHGGDNYFLLRYGGSHCQKCLHFIAQRWRQLAKNILIFFIITTLNLAEFSVDRFCIKLHKQVSVGALS